MAEGPTYTGTVRSFNPTKGWGFIECAETKGLYGSDVFLLKTALNGYGVNQGDQVSFQAVQSPKGIQAANVRILTAGQTQTFYGEVKSFNPTKGFGFISSQAAEQVYGKDVFVMKSEFPGGMASPGTQVMFKAKLEERGPVATEVTLLGVSGWGPGGWGGGGSGSWDPSWGGGGSWGGSAPGGWGGGWGGQGAPSGMWNNNAWKPPGENEVFFGSIKAINTEKGWGHISCDAMQKLFGKDVFVLKSSLEGLAVEVGTPVSFSVQSGAKGPHAVNIQPFDISMGSHVFTGKVRSWNETKGWGFIVCPESFQIYRGDPFLHKKDLEGIAVKDGDEVSFMVDISQGRPQAKQVTAGSFSPAQTAPATARAAPY